MTTKITRCHILIFNKIVFIDFTIKALCNLFRKVFNINSYLSNTKIYSELHCDYVCFYSKEICWDFIMAILY